MRLITIIGSTSSPQKGNKCHGKSAVMTVDLGWSRSWRELMGLLIIASADDVASSEISNAQYFGYFVGNKQNWIGAKSN